MKLDKRLHSLAAHWKSFCQNRTQDEWEKAEMEIAFYLCNHFCIESENMFSDYGIRVKNLDV